MGNLIQNRAIDEITTQKSSREIMMANEEARQFTAFRAGIQETVKKKNPLVREYMKIFVEQESDPKTYIGRMAAAMKKALYKSEVYKQAAELCVDPEDKNKLLERSREMGESTAVVNYRRYLDGLDYMSGRKATLDPETEKFFRDELRAPIVNGDVYEKYRTTNMPRPKNKAEKNLMIYQERTATAMAERLYTEKCSNQDTINQQFFAKYPLKERRKVDLMIDRMTPASFCVSMLVRRGYDLDDILDPAKLRDVKEQVGQEYKEIRESADITRYVNEMYDGAVALKDAYMQYLNKHKDEIKTVRDMVCHSNRLGYLSATCHDMNQELDRFKRDYFRKDQRKESVRHTREEYDQLSDEMSKLRMGNSLGAGTRMEYEPDPQDITSERVSSTMMQRFYAKCFVEELQKENPDYSEILISPDTDAKLRRQMCSLPELKSLFKNDNFLDLGKTTGSDLERVGYLLDGTGFIKDKVSFRKPRTMVKAQGEPEVAEGVYGIEADEELDSVIYVGERQVVETNVPAHMDRFLNTLDKGRALRGKETDNSGEFNGLLERFDAVRKNLENPALSNADYMAEMNTLKAAAEVYILAKREQKGYLNTSVADKSFDDKMLGKEKGADSIFTSRGKDRYEFAVTILEAVTEMGNALRASESEHQLQEAEQGEIEAGM